MHACTHKGAHPQELLENPTESIPLFFSDLIAYVTTVRNLRDYRVFVRPGETLCAEVRYEIRGNLTAPLTQNSCLSCNTESEIAKASFVQETEHHRIWLDARGRSAYVLTPKRHVMSMTELTKEELASFWHDLSASLIMQDFVHLEVNEGNCRKLPHLHLKAFLSNEQFQAMKQKWSVEQQRKFDLIKKICEKEREKHEAAGDSRSMWHKKRRVTEPAGTSTAPLRQGTVKRVESAGWGFVSESDGPNQRFFSAHSCDDFDSLCVGNAVLFELQPNPNPAKRAQQPFIAGNVRRSSKDH